MELKFIDFLKMMAYKDTLQVIAEGIVGTNVFEDKVENLLKIPYYNYRDYIVKSFFSGFNDRGNYSYIQVFLMQK